MADKQTAAARYEQLKPARDSALKRARDAALVTIPRLFPLEDHGSDERFRSPNDSLGARAVNTLTNKLLLTLLPPNSPFHRNLLDTKAIKDLGVNEGKDESAIGTEIAEIEEALVERETAIHRRIESSAIRAPLAESIRRIIVGGSDLLKWKSGGGVRRWGLSQFVIKRDPDGTWREIVIEESVHVDALPKNTRTRVMGDLTEDESKTNMVKLYTWVRRVGDQVHDHQEVKNKIIEGSKSSYPADSNPWIPLRFNRVDGEDYGRGMVEDYYGYLYNLEELAGAITDGAKQAAKVVWLVDPGGSTNLKALNEADSGKFVAGNIEDVVALRLDKAADMGVALQTMQWISEQIEQVFLLNTTGSKTAGRERVTAEEIRFLIQEQESNLGGVFSLQSQELQLPLVLAVEADMIREGKLEKLPDEYVKPTVVAGLEALGRNNELNRLDSWVHSVGRDFGPTALEKYTHVNNVLSRRANALNIDPDGLVKTDEELRADLEAERQQELLARVGPQAVQQIGQAVQANAEQLQE